jgi:hypothetical protein
MRAYGNTRWRGNCTHHNSFPHTQHSRTYEAAKTPGPDSLHCVSMEKVLCTLNVQLSLCLYAGVWEYEVAR